MTDSKPLLKLQDLREKAEDQVRLTSPLPLWDGWPAAALSHELQVYHAELTAQNEELQRTVAELAREHQLYHTLYEHAPTAYFTLDEHAHILNVNQAGEQLLGFDRGRLLNRRFLQFIGPGHRAEFNRLLETLPHTTGGAASERFSVIHCSEEQLEVQLQALTLPDSAQDQPTSLLTLVNLTPLFEAQKSLRVLNAGLEDRVRESTQHLHVLAEQFRHQARHDALTGLHNRAAFEEDLALALGELHAQGEAFAVLFCDIDRFKRINDSLGHPAGDQMLRELARRLHTVVRPTDRVARLGGDEFAVLLHGVAGQALVSQVIRRLEEALKVPFVVSGQELFIQMGSGVLLVTADYFSSEEILKDVDLALYQAKRGGPAGTRVFEPSMRGEFRGQLELEAYLRHALERDELVVHYQPIVDLQGGHLLGLEALVRWQHPQRGLLPAGAFVPLAEELGLIGEFDAWVLQTAVRQLAEWPLDCALDRSLWLNVNVSAAHLKQVAAVTAPLATTPLPAPWQVLIEITERVLTHPADTDAATLRTLRDAGVELVVDDFGIGASSLSSLHRFPLRMLKIDRSFVATLDQNRELVRTIAVMGHSLGLAVVAEGIETEAQRTQLIELGLTAGQGYLFARPMPAAQLKEHLHSTLKFP
ncbi:putative bifunctional diguanylate cyclase/phosphodiesterase [Deinococcus marmoris]|uniref:Diguanylate cyclase/phosphodiesterase (GGDEF & EAL domains) with PAS/PAC sensor(S) n=1 Tax=Deinococcus marmoris TaxID=249408 RepID=A0A1U7P0E7_9DEIO|nr:EAL domain-containing protein [Deinococcus marmoris]OLV18639.1 diguanylate cyclase/phosphodiesterase (GGDEF & EAL domains) with PAS/PAC sensor(s) [Deinococcus marmoris]